MTRRWQDVAQWRLRANLNSIGLAVLLVLIASLFKFNYDRSSDINASRVKVAREACEAQNDRHDTTVRTYDAALAQLPAEQRRRTVRNRKFTLALIDALAPTRDCEALVEQIRRADN